MNDKKEPPVILIVDDEPVIQETFKAIFNRHFKVLTAGNDREALETINKNQVNLVFLDINIPGINGIEILRQIKKCKENLPVIMMTGGESEILARESEKSGACGYISKPFDVALVLKLAHETINRTTAIATGKEKLLLKK